MTTTIAVLGGTGPQGRGLARRFAAGGLDVILGSRDAARAEATAKEDADAVGARGHGVLHRLGVTAGLAATSWASPYVFHGPIDVCSNGSREQMSMLPRWPGW